MTSRTPLFRPVSTQNASEAVVEQVATAIDLALLVPGDRLPPERELAATLGVSRPTLREALRVLTGSGYVRIRRGASGGAFVARRPLAEGDDGLRDTLRPRRRELLALLEWRRVVEAEAAAFAALRVTGDELRALRARMVESGGIAAQSRDHWRAADSRFHIAVAEASGNPYLVDAVRRVRASLAAALDAALAADQNPRAPAAEHEAIMAALQARDPEAARVSAAEHGRGTEERLRAFLEA